jgi:mono/diheme cytochrome c family protein
MPRPIIYVLLVLVALSLIPVGLMYKSRATASRESSRIQVVYDMDRQSYVKPQTRSEFFADGQSMRPHPTGTVARGRLQENSAFYRGVIRDTTYTEEFPLEITPALLDRGQERYEIYCAPCHATSGNGAGMVHVRATALAEGTWTPPTDLTSQTVIDRPVGHIYNTITRGIRNMPAYGPQIPPKDRWAITAYVRALQLSRNATLADVAPDVRAALEAEPIAMPEPAAENADPAADAPTQNQGE